MKEGYEMKQVFMRENNMIHVASKQKEGYKEEEGVLLKRRRGIQ